MDTYPQSNFIYSDSDHGVYSLTSGLSDYNAGDTGITESRFNNGYGVYVPTKLVMMTENVSATQEEEMESGLSYAARVDYDVIAGSVKNNHGRPTGSVVRMDAHGSAASANLGLCSAVLTADYGGSYRNGGMALRFGGCLDYALEPPASPSDSRFDFNYGQLGGDYAGIAYLAFLNVGNSFFNSGRLVKGGGWGYSILVLPPANYSPVEI